MIRTIITYVYFGIYILLSLFGLLFLQVLKLFGQDRKVNAIAAKVAGNWARTMVWLAGGKINVTGKENLPDGPVLFVGNHQGSFDIPIYLGFLCKPTGFVAKIEMDKLPVFRTWMRHLKCVFMDRNDMRQAMRIINEAAEILKDGYSLTIFPEGTRSKGDKLGEFKSGSLKLALKAGVPIVPVAMDGSYKLLEQHKHLHPAKVGLYICPPIPTAELTKEEQRDLSDRVRRAIESKLTIKGDF
jgi:1-acyl-sn-glycerol-3-phosphate acyltransferase